MASGRSIEVLSTLSEENAKADSAAYKAFMHHLREVDSEKPTDIIIQIENEVGVLGGSRDRSGAANEECSEAVPKQLMDYLQTRKCSGRRE